MMGIVNNTTNEIYLHYTFHSCIPLGTTRMILLRRKILLQTKSITVHRTKFHTFDPASIWKENFLSTVANETQMAPI